MKEFSNFSEEKIVNALRYGQVLGAINCLYDGARGLMYRVDKLTLDKMVDLVSHRKPISEILNPKITPKVIKMKEEALELNVILQST